MDRALRPRSQCIDQLVEGVSAAEQTEHHARPGTMKDCDRKVHMAHPNRHVLVVGFRQPDHGALDQFAGSKFSADFGVASLWIGIVPQGSIVPVTKSFRSAGSEGDVRVFARKLPKHGVEPPSAFVTSTPPSKKYGLWIEPPG